MRAITESFINDAIELQQRLIDTLNDLKNFLGRADMRTLMLSIGSKIADLNVGRRDLSDQVRKIEKDIWRKERLDRVLESELRILERVVDILVRARDSKTITRDQLKEMSEDFKTFIVGADEVIRRLKHIRVGIASPV